MIRAALLDLAMRRSPKTFCPSEAARSLSPDWRRLMPDIRAVAAGMEEIICTQKGVATDAVAAKGPIRLALRK